MNTRLKLVALKQEQLQPTDQRISYKHNPNNVFFSLCTPYNFFLFPLSIDQRPLLLIAPNCKLNAHLELVRTVRRSSVCVSPTLPCASPTLAQRPGDCPSSRTWILRPGSTSGGSVALGPSFGPSRAASQRQESGAGRTAEARPWSLCLANSPTSCGSRWTWYIRIKVFARMDQEHGCSSFYDKATLPRLPRLPCYTYCGTYWRHGILSPRSLFETPSKVFGAKSKTKG